MANIKKVDDLQLTFDEQLQTLSEQELENIAGGFMGAGDIFELALSLAETGLTTAKSFENDLSPSGSGSEEGLAESTRCY